MTRRTLIRALGWPMRVVHGQEAADDDERRFIYDTTLYSHGNGGHTFGDAHRVRTKVGLGVSKDL